MFKEKYDILHNNQQQKQQQQKKRMHTHTNTQTKTVKYCENEQHVFKEIVSFNCV